MPANFRHGVDSAIDSIQGDPDSVGNITHRNEIHSVIGKQ